MKIASTITLLALLTATICAQKPTCNERCTAQPTKPVCATNGRTYPNACIVRMEACRKGDIEFRVASEGPCGAAEKCMRPCPKDLKPVCGSDGVTYSNPCEFSVAACTKRDPSFRIAMEGPCTNTCSERCPTQHKPVCGTNGVTYPNECVLRMDACRKGANDIGVASEGPCGAAEKCMRPCPKDLKPVCGSDGVTYSNPCEFSVAACTKRDPSFRIAMEGSCTNTCNERCPPQHKPVCGTNGVTYPNECVLRMDACRKGDNELGVGSEGPCGDAEKCMRPCPKDLKPVCGSDGVTYSNPCEFSVAACTKRDPSFRIAKGGPCN